MTARGSLPPPSMFAILLALAIYPQYTTLPSPQTVSCPTRAATGDGRHGDYLLSYLFNIQTQDQGILQKRIQGFENFTYALTD